MSSRCWLRQCLGGCCIFSVNTDSAQARAGLRPTLGSGKPGGESLLEEGEGKKEEETEEEGRRDRRRRRRALNHRELFVLAAR